MVRVEEVQVDRPTAATIAGLVNRAFAVEHWFVSGDRISADGVLQMADNGQFFLASDDAGAAIGCAYAEVREHGRGYFGLLSVEASQQRGGVGQRLVERIEAFLRARGCQTIEITVVSLRAELFSYYEKRGYRVDGRTLPFPREATQPCELIYMSRRLAL